MPIIGPGCIGGIIKPSGGAGPPPPTRDVLVSLVDELGLNTFKWTLAATIGEESPDVSEFEGYQIFDVNSSWLDPIAVVSIEQVDVDVLEVVLEYNDPVHFTDNDWRITTPSGYIFDGNKQVELDQTGSVNLLPLTPFGFSTDGGSDEALAGNFVCAVGPFTAASRGFATVAKAYVKTSASVNFTLGVYANSGGLPGALLRDSGQVNVNAGGTPNLVSLIQSNLDSALEITAGTVYWIGIRASTSWVGRFTAEVGKSLQYRSSAYVSGVLDDPFGTPGGAITSKKFSCWVE